MTILFIAIATGVLLGTVFLWLSGYNTGQAVHAQGTEDISEINAALSTELDTEKRKVAHLNHQLKSHTAPPKLPPSPAPKASATNDDKENEIARLSSRIIQMEGERDKALFERDNLKEELDFVTENAAKDKTPEKPTTLPRPNNHATTESEALDELQAKLDMEKVKRQKEKTKHQKTMDELERLKKIAAVKLASGAENGATGESAASGTQRFKTMAIGMRSPVAGNSGQDILRAALEKVQTEKDKVESELSRAKKEIQLLKMRS